MFAKIAIPLGVKADFSCRSLTDWIRTLRQLVQLCQRAPTDAIQLLLAADDPAVEMELLRRMFPGPVADPKKSWVRKHQRVYEDMRIT